MRKLFWISTLILAAMFITACGASQAASAVPATPAPAATQALQPQPKATSRGDKLEASDPATVKLGAGKPVLVEFFRFT